MAFIEKVSLRIRHQSAVSRKAFKPVKHGLIYKH